MKKKEKKLKKSVFKGLKIIDKIKNEVGEVKMMEDEMKKNEEEVI